MRNFFIAINLCLFIIIVWIISRKLQIKAGKSNATCYRVFANKRRKHAELLISFTVYFIIKKNVVSSVYVHSIDILLPAQH